MILLLQSQVLLVNSDLYRSIIKQASGMIVFHSLRARQSLKNLSVQLYDKASFLPAVSADIMKCNTRYDPLIIDLRNEVPEKLRIRSGFLGLNATLSVYYI